jgi:Lon-like ATP-dependent protease
VNSSQIQPRPKVSLPPAPQVGTVLGLAVHGPNMGTLVEIEASAIPTNPGQGRLTVTGVVDEEELGEGGRKIRRKSMARAAVENVLTVLKAHVNVDPGSFDIHVNFPGGTPVDGPSAGLAMAVAICSALTGKKVDNCCAMTGEMSILGKVKPVGGIVPKVEAARQAGVKRVFIPRENHLSLFEDLTDIEVLPVDNLKEVLNRAFAAAPVLLEEAKTLAAASAQGAS